MVAHGVGDGRRFLTGSYLFKAFISNRLLGVDFFDATQILLTAQQMRDGEAAAMKAGVTSTSLMERAGQAAAQSILRGWEKRPVFVACGPGNNGGDGFVIAEILKAAGWSVRVGLLGQRGALKGDARLMADRYAAAGGVIESIDRENSAALLTDCQLIVDALFGTGLTRVVEGAAHAFIDAANAHAAPVVSIDLPSGVHTDSGAVMGTAIKAHRTLTFFCAKLGHFLFPGRAFSGAVEILDIGIERDVLASLAPQTFVNGPRLWGGAFPQPSFVSHKYTRGGAAVLSGPRYAGGAARLAAYAALRVGAGIVTLLAPRMAADEHAAQLNAVLLRLADTPGEAAGFFRDARYGAGLVGPGAGVGPQTSETTLALLKAAPAMVLDADALTSFEGAGQRLFDALRPQDVMTPHGGEFSRLFTGLIGTPEDRLSAARAAAEKAGCVVVLKGADTVIAAPDGRAAINANAPPSLATAGSGDVLAGFIVGLKAQGMSAFDAAAAGVWLHGACAQRFGPGLIAEDIADALPGVYRALFDTQSAVNAGSEVGA